MVVQAQTFQLGKIYLVKVAEVSIKYWGMSHVPIIGDLHEDKDIIGFDPLHYHIDWRFVPKRAFHNLIDFFDYSKEYANVVLDEHIIRTSEKKMTMKREFREYPHFFKKSGKIVPAAYWMPALQEKYENAKLKNMICPHRRADLSNVAPDENGIVTCPLHGLKFDCKTKKLVKVYGAHNRSTAKNHQDDDCAN